jgi:hypothetical protein
MEVERGQGTGREGSRDWEREGSEGGDAEGDADKHRPRK